MTVFLVQHTERKVLVFWRSAKEHYGTHYVSSRLFAAEYLRWGFHPVFVDANNPGDLAVARDLMKAGEVTFCHCEQGQTLDLQVNVGGKDINVFEFFKIPVVAHVRDYPFCEWILPKLQGAAKRALVFHTDVHAPDMVAALGVDKGKHLHAPHVHLDFRYPGERRLKSSERDIRFLYVGSFFEPESFREAFRLLTPRWTRVLDGLIDATVMEFHRPAHRILLDDVLPGLGEERPSSEDLAKILFAGTQFVRNERRRRLFLKMVRYPVDLVWAGPAPSAPGPSRATLTLGIPLLETLQRMNRARFMFMTLAAFSHSLSERLLSAMSRGCVPIVQKNALIAQTFEDGADLFLLRNDLDNFEEVVERAQSAGEFAAMSQTAMRRVASEFSPALRVRQILANLLLDGPLQFKPVVSGPVPHDAIAGAEAPMAL